MPIRAGLIAALACLAGAACSDLDSGVRSAMESVRSTAASLTDQTPADAAEAQALALAREQKWEELRSHCQAWIQQQPDRPEAWAELGYAELALDHMEAGLAASQRATALRPDYPEAWNNIGIALTRLGRVDDAKTAFRRASASSPER
jgi:tetratricopeptide (TPR) repeat protein